MAEGSSIVAWKDETVFMDSSGCPRQGSVFVDEPSEIAWSSKTTFTANAAMAGSAIYAESSTIDWIGEKTTFSMNDAFYDGGAIRMRNASPLSWDGETGFIGNTAGGAGGAVYVMDDSNVYWQGDTTF